MAHLAITTVRGKPQRLHLDFLDGLRALAALLVIVDHACCTLWWNADAYGPRIVFMLGNVQLFGHFAVSTFIVLSGFCLMLPIAIGNGTLRGGAKHFYWKRARRILPPYYFALAFSLLLIATLIGKPTNSHWDTSIHVDGSGLLTHLLLLHNLFPHDVWQINNALWSVAVEWQIYFLFPLLVLAWQRLGGGKATLIFLVCAVGTYFFLRHTTFSGLMPHYLGLFAIGALGAQVAFSATPAMQRLRDRLPCGPLILLMAMGMVGLLSRYTWAFALKRLVFFDMLVGLLATLLLIMAARPQPTWVRKFLSIKPLAFLGTFSYSIYLIHVPVQQLSGNMRFGPCIYLLGSHFACWFWQEHLLYWASLTFSFSSANVPF